MSMPTSTDELGRLLLHSIAGREQLEFETVVLLLNDPGAGIAVAAALGLTGESFAQRDLRLIYHACELAGRIRRGAVLGLIRRALRAEGLWTASGDGRRGVWSEGALLRWADHFCEFAAPTIQAAALRVVVPQLRDMIARQRDACDYLRHACRILEGWAA